MSWGGVDGGRGGRYKQILPDAMEEDTIGTRGMGKIERSREKTRFVKIT